MNTTSAHSIESIIRDYIEHREQSLLYGKKRMDAEKEYNKLLAKYGGENRHYSLDHANDIYKAYIDMITFGEASRQADSLFIETEEKLKEIGRILFEPTISADITISSPGQAPRLSSVTVIYNNGQVMVNQA
jgi:hypothetical protein